MRDDFLQPIKNTLSARSGYTCANPECRAATSGPQAQEEKAVNVGVAAHISGAAKGGPRFPNLTPQQRANIINGIWLCQTCAKLIDADEKRYSIALLYHWKLSTEHAAHQQIGKPKASPALPENLRVPNETVRIVQDRNLSKWSMGSTANSKPIMIVSFYGHITEINGMQTRVVAVELPDPPTQAEMVLICNDHDARRPQILHPNEIANISVTSMITPVDNLDGDGTWLSPVVFVDQFGNRHELQTCSFRNLASRPF
jgi:hypothetical protein